MFAEIEVNYGSVLFCVAVAVAIIFSNFHSFLNHLKYLTIKLFHVLCLFATVLVD